MNLIRNFRQMALRSCANHRDFLSADFLTVDRRISIYFSFIAVLSENLAEWNISDLCLLCELKGENAIV